MVKITSDPRAEQNLMSTKLQTDYNFKRYPDEVLHTCTQRSRGGWHCGGKRFPWLSAGHIFISSSCCTMGAGAQQWVNKTSGATSRFSATYMDFHHYTHLKVYYSFSAFSYCSCVVSNADKRKWRDTIWARWKHLNTEKKERHIRQR